MKERPIIFSAPMVRAILEGRKTQTRRVVKPDGKYRLDIVAPSDGGQSCCSYGRPGDRLWVREAFIHEPADYCWEASVSIPCRPAETVYRADQEGDTRGAGWSSPIHMPRSLSRITLEITGVRVERLQDISAEDCIAEGLRTTLREHDAVCDLQTQYQDLWKSIHGPESWDANPWVWVVEFAALAALRGEA